MLTVINYHYIRQDFTAKYPSIFGVTPETFKKQLLLLKDKGDFVSAIEFVQNKDAILKSQSNYFFITFDDGLKEQYQLALPILEQLQIPAVFFANSRNYEDKKVSTVHKIHLLRSTLSPSDFLKFLESQNVVTALSDADKQIAKNTYIYDNEESALLKYCLNYKMNFSIQEEIIKNVFDKYFDEEKVIEELYMNNHEIIQLGKKKYLGSHTHNHYPLGLLSQNEINFELKNSKSFFEKLTNTSIDMVAYPYGSPEACPNEVGEIAKTVGYEFGFTTTKGINTDENNLLLLNRFNCNDLPGGKNFKE